MKTNIIICQGSSCFSRGNKENLAFIQCYLKEHDLAANVSFKGQLCGGRCKESPIIIINEIVYTEVDEKKLSHILTDIFKK
jgi:NADH:ubiquinone oxidoreductase subunit E